MVIYSQVLLHPLLKLWGLGDTGELGYVHAVHLFFSAFALILNVVQCCSETYEKSTVISKQICTYWGSLLTSQTSKPAFLMFTDLTQTEDAVTSLLLCHCLERWEIQTACNIKNTATDWLSLNAFQSRRDLWAEPHPLIHCWFAVATLQGFWYQISYNAETHPVVHNARKWHSYQS